LLIAQEQSDRITLYKSLSQQFEATRQVRLEDGTVVSVDHQLLLSALDQPDTEPARLAQFLRAMLAMIDTWPEAANPDLDRSSLDRILAQSEFQWDEAELQDQTNWLQEILRRILEFIAPFLPDSLSVNADSGLSILLLTIGSLILILILGLFIRGLRANLVQISATTPEESEAQQILSVQSALDQARLRSEASDRRGAVRYLYLAALLMLEDRGLIPFDHSLTNHEVLQSVHSDPTLAAHLHPVIEIFDRVWYGFQTLDDSSFANFEEHVKQLRRQT
jgi:hypothetical protein